MSERSGVDAMTDEGCLHSQNHTHSSPKEHIYGLEGFPVVVSSNGSIDLENFPKMAHHFVSTLPEGFGKGGKPVILIMDGHSSRWSPLALKLLKENNVHVWVIASHSSAWGQVGDVGPNSKFKKWYNKFARLWRRAHHRYKLRKHHFNKIFVRAYNAYVTETLNTHDIMLVYIHAHMRAFLACIWEGGGVSVRRRGSDCTHACIHNMHS